MLFYRKKALFIFTKQVQRNVKRKKYLYIRVHPDPMQAIQVMCFIFGISHIHFHHLTIKGIKSCGVFQTIISRRFGVWAVTIYIYTVSTARKSLFSVRIFKVSIYVLYQSLKNNYCNFVLLPIPSRIGLS
jgi:hypothetical protein